MKTDAQIQKDVMEELKWEPFLTANEIGVAVKNGIVTLSGTVDVFSKRSAAEKAAKRVEGVKAVAEEIEVRLHGSSQRNDSEIAEAVLNALKWHSALRDGKIKVKVEAGIVTLEGEVEWEFQKKSAQMMVENITGVWGLINNIKIAKKTSPKEIQQKISEAFLRSASIDAGKVKVEIAGNKAILTGIVRSWFEKDEAEKAAWAAPGINLVENKLQIESEVNVF